MLIALMLVKLALMVAVVVHVVPFFTSQQVAVQRGSYLTALLVLLALGLATGVLNVISGGTLAQLDAMSFGIVGLLVNAGALMLVGKIKPDAFRVPNFYAAFFAAVAISFSSFVISVLFAGVLRLIG